MGKANNWKMIVLVGIVAAFIAMIAFESSGETEQFPVPRAASMQEVKQFQYQHIPGLERAENLGLTKKYHIERPIPGSNRTLKIEKAWYNREQAYVFYSIDFLPLKQNGDELPDSIQLPDISFSMSLPDGVNSEPALSTNNGIFYNGRLYRFARADSFKKAGVDSIVLKSLNVLAQGESYSLRPIQLPLDYTAKQEIVHKIPLDWTFAVKDYRLTLDQFVIGTSANRLTFHFNNPNKGEEFKGLELSVVTGAGEEDMSPLAKTREGNRYEYVFDPFEKLPDKVKLKIKGIRMTTHDFFRFWIDLSDLEKTDEVMQVDRKLANKKETNILLDHLRYNEKGLEVQIRYDPEREKPNNIRLTVAEPTFPRRNWTQNSGRPLLLLITNEANRNAFEGQTAVGPGSLYRFSLDANYLKGLNRLRIAVQNLPFFISIEKSLTFRPSDKG